MNWIVMVGKLYFVGLGTEWPKLGFVFSKLEDRAQKFTSLSSAKDFAEASGGRVIRV